jgi:ABC-type transport system substrate-binding protein
LWDTLLGPAGDERSFEVETLGTAANVEVISDHEIVFHLGRPELNLLAFISDAFTDPLIYNLAHWEEVGREGYGKNPVGTGPWKFVEYNPGSSLTYERVDYEHWRVTPDFETLRYVFAPEDVTRLAMLLTGEADIVEIPRELQEEVLNKNMSITRSTLPAFMVWIAIGGQYLEDKRDSNDPNTDPLVRQAMNLAIDRKQLNDAFFAGKMELMANTGWHPSDPTFNPEWTVPEYNPEKARELLQQAGYTADAGPKVKFMAANLVGVPELKELGVPMSQMMEEVGFNMELEVGEFQPIRTAYKAREMQGTLWTHRTGFWPAWRNMLVYFVSPALDGAVFMYEDPFTEESYERFLNSIDLEERDNLIGDMGDFMYAQNATIPMGFLFAEFGVNPAVIAEYSVNNSYFGGMKGHEYTKVVRR